MAILAYLHMHEFMKNCLASVLADAYRRNTARIMKVKIGPKKLVLTLTSLMLITILKIRGLAGYVLLTKDC